MDSAGRTSAVAVRCAAEHRNLAQDQLSLRAAFCLTFTDTEIDWKAYMEQVGQYLAGERDYALIKGGTGPLWFIHLSITIDISYPAGHVWIYTALYKITSNGKDVFSAQVVFVLLYLATLGITISMYRAARVNQRRGVSKI